MTRMTRRSLVILGAAMVIAPVFAADMKVDLSKEVVGKTPTTFQPMVGTWTVVQEPSTGSGQVAEKVIKVDGGIWKAAQTPAAKMLIENARRLYGTTNEALMDDTKMFASFPVAVLNKFDNFTNGTISVKFKTIAGESDRASGILFNVKPNGDWLSIRYNDTENNVALWEFHNGIRRNMKFNRDKKFMLDPKCTPGQTRDRGTCAEWHELKLTIQDADLKAWLDGELAMTYTLGSEPGPGRDGAAANDDLFPKNNAVLRPPVMGRIGLWSKTDSTSYFKDYVVSPAK
jgi:hypothetical protein